MIKALHLITILIPVALFALVIPAASSQEFPNKPIRFIVTGPVGSPTDIVARRLTAKLADRFRQQIVVVNRAGGRTIGPGDVATADPDGYTWLFTVNTYITVNPWLYKRLPYDPARDFVPVSIVASLRNFILAVHPSVPVRSVKEYIQMSLRQPGKVSAANAGSGSPAHLVTALFALEAKVSLLHVPYKGGNIALTDLMGGYVDSMFAPAQNAIGVINDGKIIPLAITAPKRIAPLPKVPTFAEAGVPGITLDEGFWYGVLGPAATPRAIVKTLSDAIVRELRTEDMRTGYAVLGVDPIGNSPSEFAAIIERDRTKWSRVVREAQITVE
jgi:tripartite-type tricarboxylate transporter receptor subunit TctC